MLAKRIWALLFILIGAGLAFFLYKYPNFRLGLDLSGGSHLVYEADTSSLASSDISDAMESLRGVIERRINAFGVTEPIIQLEQGSALAGSQHRLIVELPGVTDVNEAVKLINRTPSLDFRTVASSSAATASSTVTFHATGLTGRYIKRATVEFASQSINPSIGLEFTSEGAKLFADITSANVGKPLGIFLDGQLLSAPRVNEPIRDGKAAISGQFSLDEAKELARNLNLGALPVPIKLVSTETIGATLGDAALQAGVQAGLIGFVLIAIFMILWYRLPGVAAVVALALYGLLTLVIFKLLGITITAAGIAGLILSLGIAVDANILIFERMKEELRKGDSIHAAIREGWRRAWTSIRDSNLSTVISALILFWFGSSFIKGFALTLVIGVLASLFTAITVTRILLVSIAPDKKTGFRRWLVGSGLTH